ncbi:unnamed protein product [Acanthoscelides obtectus]|uniref:Uncharacterized protein n=1 Tax=Acanthoscelides obtectus TaxID=200917 RepID=A0A9P0KUL4_ACAOB|nr:unnamed protein product [Acanthoscelides obtectus]CAK1627622.1 hypothetical protein AOBTE_LOCUS4714 [Acanthoscelides obtectus]
MMPTVQQPSDVNTGHRKPTTDISEFLIVTPQDGNRLQVTEIKNGQGIQIHTNTTIADGKRKP